MFYIPHILSIYCLYSALQDLSASIVEKRAYVSAETAPTPHYVQSLETNLKWTLTGFSLYLFHLCYYCIFSVFGSSFWLIQLVSETCFCIFFGKIFLRMQSQLDTLPETLALVHQAREHMLSDFIRPRMRDAGKWVVGLYSSSLNHEKKK
jgi:hypothetical protein